MIMYTVHLSINQAIYSAFQIWLLKHIKEILQFPGFLQASILKPEDKPDPDKERLIVQYELENREALQTYLIEFAPTMRAEGVALFGDQFSAERSIFTVQNIIFPNA
jgi:Domain of unknown function (DUF4286)